MSEGASALLAAGNTAQANGAPADKAAAPVETANVSIQSLPDWAKGEGWTTELQQAVAGAKWDSPRAVVESYANLRKLESGEKVAIPKDPADDAAWAKVHQKLGAFEKPEEYVSSYKAKDGAPAMDQAFLGAMGSLAQRAGLTARQWKIMSEGYDDLAIAAAKAGTDDDAALQAQLQADQDALRKEWPGSKWDENVAHFQRAALAADLTAEDVDKMEAALGHARTVKMLAALGSKFGVEAKFIDGQPVNGGAISPEMARSQIRDLMSDSAFVKAYTSGDMAARAKMEMLHKIAAGAS